MSKAQKGILSNLQLYKTKWFSDLVDENMLHNSLLTRPHEVSTMISYLMGTMDNESTSVLDALTGGMGNTLTVESNSYEWSVMIEHDKAVTIYDAKWMGSSIASTDTPGIDGSPIQIWVEDRWFGPGAIVAFDDREYQARIMDEGYQDGAYWVYTIQVVSNNSAAFIPPSLLESGSRISREGSAYEEGSEESDIVNYNTPFKLRNHLTTMRLSYDITGSAMSTVMVIEMRDPKTKKSSRMWSTIQEWRAMRQWYRSIDRHLVYSQYSVNPTTGVCQLTGKNGRPIFIGAGLLQQISPSNRRYYTKLTLDLLEDYLQDLSYNILGMTQRKFVALTGEMGMREFDRVLRERATTYNLVDSVFISGSGQNLTLGGQFTTYKMLNGIELTLRHFPLYDNPIHNRKNHPVTGKPAESYRMTFIDFTPREGEANVKLVVRKDREMLMGYTGGFSKPGGFLTSKNALMSNARDGHQVHFLSEKGIMIVDPTTSGELILDVDGSRSYADAI